MPARYDHTLWNELTSPRFLDGPHGACLLGPVGVGKTHLATALGHIAVHRRVSVLMLRADAMFKRLKAARLDSSVEAEMRRLTQVQLLLIDDFRAAAAGRHRNRRLLRAGRGPPPPGLHRDDLQPRTR